MYVKGFITLELGGRTVMEAENAKIKSFWQKKKWKMTLKIISLKLCSMNER